MAERLIIERLEFPCRIGILAEERRAAQPLGVDLELEYPSGAFLAAVSKDHIGSAVDYAGVSKRIIQIGTAREFDLVETLAERLCEMVFAEFPIAALRLWVRKLVPPITDVKGSVGVRIERSRREQALEPRPARFLMEHVQALPHGDVLDLAAGSGRNALYLASLGGYRVHAIDRNESALSECAAEATRRGLRDLTTEAMELEDDSRPADLGKERYDAILVFFYLHRPLFPAMLSALKPGGVLIYETFLIDNHHRHQHPRRKEFCLGHNELLRLAPGLRVLHYDEGEHAGGHGAEPAFTAQLIASKPER